LGPGSDRKSKGGYKTKAAINNPHSGKAVLAAGEQTTAVN
jgi:hypothetical protein